MALRRGFAEGELTSVVAVAGQNVGVPLRRRGEEAFAAN